MSLRKSVALFVGATAVVAGGISIGAVNKPTLSSGKPAAHKAVPFAPMKTPQATEPLFRGDMIPEIGLGCSNSVGSTGGPNDWATRVTPTLPPSPSWGVVSTTYNIFSFNSGPTWNLMAWNNTAGPPGTVIGTCPLGAGSGSNGNHTIAVAAGCLTIPAASGPTWFFGLSQGADPQGVRIGMDTNGTITPNTVFIRAPVCGLAAFGTVESIGFPGNWVHRIIADNTLPVELMDFDIS
jgi:hypothetical protein